MNMPLTADLPTKMTAAQALRAVDAQAFFVWERTMKRIIKGDRGLGGLGIQIPHRQCYRLSRERFLALASPEEVGVATETELPEQLTLIAESVQLTPIDTSASSMRLLWRVLFHARLDQDLERGRHAGAIDAATVEGIIFQIGQMEWEEAFRVLRQENRLLAVDDVIACFLEFVAFFFELRYFQPELLPFYFPALTDLNRVEGALRGMIEPESILQATRPEGATLEETAAATGAPFAQNAEPPQAVDVAAYEASMRLAARARDVGNHMRAAILYYRARQASPAERIAELDRELDAILRTSVNRLKNALMLDERSTEQWQTALPCVVAPASRGLWPVAARFLYDLQKACVDSERELYALDLVEWVCSLGKKAIKRPVPLQKDALRVKHLRSALKRLPSVPILPEQRLLLSQLLHDAIHHCEEHLRDEIRPLLRATFREVGFEPANFPEHIALDKITEELLDRIAERGFINMGDVRDAISRNQLKLEDASPRQMILGDALLRANRKLAIMLDGVYHRGEIYLRWLQRLSSLLFGTVVGRWIVLFLILPFGGALATAIFAQEMLHLGKIHVHVHSPGHEEIPLDDPHESPQKPGIHWTVGLNEALIALCVLGLYYMLLIHVPAVRHGTWRFLVHTGRFLRAVFWDLPLAVLTWGPIRAFLESGPIVFLRRRVLRPLVIAALAVLLTYLFGPEGLIDELSLGLGVFVLGLLFFNSRFGQRLEEAASDWTMRNWYWLRSDVLPGLIALILELFRRILDRIERVLYAVDEWLRFRPGDNRLALIVKPVLGLIWFLVTYLIRIIINLFVEPTVNPVKHFPAVTVGAKLIIPLIPMWVAAMTDAMKPFLGLALAGTIAGTVIFLFPGIFGFAVWEFKENWKLYRANRERHLKPVMIGHHGETMLRLLRPGFHSGTVPKLFLKMRTAKAAGKESKAHSQMEELHHVSSAVQHFVEREFLSFLQASKTWGGLTLKVESIGLSTNRISVRIACEGVASEPVVIAFEESSGWLLASIRQPGFLHALEQPQREVFQVALAGMYKRAAVDLVREEIACKVRQPYRVVPTALLVNEVGTTTSFPLIEEARNSRTDWRPERFVFSQRPIAWQSWVAAWTADQRGETPRLVESENLTST